MTLTFPSLLLSKLEDASVFPPAGGATVTEESSKGTSEPG
jgi:hypothetical protein